MSITVTPPLSTNTTFYKYEPFAYIFTGGSDFTVGGTLATFCTITESSVVFSGSSGFQSAGSPLGETLYVSSSAGILLYTLFISAGRFQISPTTTPISLYLSEPVTYTFTSPTALTTAYSTPSVPPGLRFTYSNASNWILSGTPTLITASSNYLFIGSNTTTGAVVSATVPIQVSGERLLMAPATSPSNTLTLGTPFSSDVFTITNYPRTATGTVTFAGSNLPPGLGVTVISSALTNASAKITGTPTSNVASTATCTLTASVTGLTRLSSVSTISFTYAPVISFTAPVVTTSTMYVNVPASLQVSATTLYPTLSVSSYSAVNLPPGLTIDVLTGLISGTPTSIATFTPTITARSDTLSTTLALTITVNPNTLTVTSNVPSTNFVFGLAIKPITVTFVSAAGTTITCTSNVPAGITGTVSGGTVTVSGIPAEVRTGIMTVTGKTSGAVDLSVNIPYSIVRDTFVFTSVPASPFTFRQNVQITPIQLAVTPVNKSAPIVYFANTPSIPPGLYVTPGGTIRGAPTQVVTNATLNGITATNGYDLVSPLNTFAYTVIADEALATSANVSTVLVPSAPVNIPITIRTLSGAVPDPLTNVISFSCYTYGLTASTTSFGGTLGACVYPDIVLPRYTELTGTVSNTTTNTISALPVVFGLAATNTQTINRYTLRWDGLKYYLCRDDGAFAYSTVQLLSASTFTGYTTRDFSNRHSYLYITENAPTTALPTDTPLFGPAIREANTVVMTGSGTFYEVTQNQLNSDPSRAGTISYNLLPGSNIPRDFQWGGNTLVVADGTSNLLTSTDSNTFSLVVPATGVGFLQCAYMSSSSWIALANGSFIVSSNADPTQGWFDPQTFVAPIVRSDGGYLLRTFPTPGDATKTRIVVGGSTLSYCDLSNSVLKSNDETTVVFSDFGTSLKHIWALTTTTKLVVGGGVQTPPGITIQYSTDTTTWSNAVNSFTTRTIDIVNAAGGWMAIGSNGNTPGVKYSADAVTWIDVSVTSTPFSPGTAIGPLQFDGTSWCVFVGCNVYRHDAYAGNIADSATWTSTVATFVGGSPTDVLYTFPIPRYTGGPPIPVLYIGPTPNGPTFVSPTASSYSLYQYVVMTPLVFQATSLTGDTPVYFLTSTPPAGMSWDSSTGTLSGRSVELGTFSVDVYAQSLVGVSKKTVIFIVSQVQIEHKTPTAAAYTAYMRAKVIADSATATVNDHAVSFEVGPFLLNRPPNKETAPEFCCDT